MPRAKGGAKTRQRRKKVLKKAKGYFGGRRKLYRSAAETVLRAGAFAYRDRRQKKRRARAASASFAKAVGSETASSARTFRSIPIPAFFSPFMNTEYESPS